MPSNSEPAVKKPRSPRRPKRRYHKCRIEAIGALDSNFAWGAAAPAALAKRFLVVLQENEYIGFFFKRLTDEGCAHVESSLQLLLNRAFEGLDLRMICVNLDVSALHCKEILEALIEELHKPFPLGESPLVVAIERVCFEDARIENWLESLKHSILVDVRKAMKQVAVGSLNGREWVRKEEAISIWREAISVRLDEDTVIWMLSLLPLHKLSKQTELSALAVLTCLLSDKLEEMICSTTVDFEKRCIQFATCFANHPASNLASSFHAWKNVATRSRACSAAVENDANPTCTGNCINEQSLELLHLDPNVISEVRRALGLFTEAQGSNDMAAEAMYLWITSKLGEIQKLFMAPAAIMAPRFFAALRDLVAALDNPLSLKTRVELLGFQHLNIEVTFRLIAVFRDALLELMKLELQDTLSTEATQGLAALLNYVGGALVYIRVQSRSRVELIQLSWAAVTKGDE